MNQLRVLHIASFTGNVGDNANHLGFRGWFEELRAESINWTSLEIREFYWKNRAWDSSFVHYANSFDLVVIGGGNYFELWVERSPTGTSIEIDLDNFRKINTPILFNALGVDPGQGASDSSVSKFRNFLFEIRAKNGFISVRNDGAIYNLEKHVGKDVLDFIYELPDGGFFVAPHIEKVNFSQESNRFIGINIASDMEDVRFSEFASGVDGFSKEFAYSVELISREHPDITFVFFPHIFRDLDIIYRVLNFLPDELRRKRVIVSEYSTGVQAARSTFGKYKSCDLILGSRFHSNVCAISLGVEVLGLFNYVQIQNLYKGLGIEDKLVEVNNPGFAENLVQKVTKSLKNTKTENLDSMNKVRKMRDKVEPSLRDWLTNVLGG